MTQEAIALRTSGDSYPGLAYTQDINKAFAALATDFAGPDDPAALAGPLMTWADTGNMLIIRRNLAGSDWVVEGVLFRRALPEYVLADVPTANVGDIWVTGEGPRRWSGSAYLAQVIKAAPSTAGNEVVVQSQVFGVGQSWQDVLSARTVGVSYTNSTSKAIIVQVTGSSSVATASLRLVVSGNQSVVGSLPVVGSFGIQAVVPAGSSYALTASSLIIIAWQEYR